VVVVGVGGAAGRRLDLVEGMVVVDSEVRIDLVAVQAEAGTLQVEILAGAEEYAELDLDLDIFLQENITFMCSVLGYVYTIQINLSQPYIHTRHVTLVKGQ